MFKYLKGKLIICVFFLISKVLLYNSDGYRALLDLKYQRMDGGYMLPEFGVAYVKRVNFVQANSMEIRPADLIVAACKCLN